MNVQTALLIAALATIADPFRVDAQQPAPAPAASCAADPSTVTTPAADKALVYVFRESSMVGAAGYEIVFVNGSLMGEFHSGNYSVCEVPPSTVVLSSLERITKVLIGYSLLADLQRKAKVNLRMEAEPSKTYYIRMWPRGKMQIVNEATGLKEIHTLHAAKTK